MILTIKGKFTLPTPNGYVQCPTFVAQYSSNERALFVAEVAPSGAAIKTRLMELAREMAKSRNDDFRVELCGDLSLPTIAQAHEKVLEAFEQDLPIVIDLDGVSNADLTLIQLLEAARLSASRRGRSLALSAPASGATRAVLERGGFLGAPDGAAFWLQDTVTP